MIPLRRLTADDRPRLRQFWIEHWGDEMMIAHGEVFYPNQLDGFVVERGSDWLGLITFVIREHAMEITSLDSLSQRRGVGTALMDKAIDEARRQNCQRVFLTTTNDNLYALGFYQRRGFELCALHRGAVNESRKAKPSIPVIGMNRVPLRDEIELELKL
ncbi:MAG TPA: GNAT family N-acetyltransferase [Anaerolineales bacterium]|nr:GNAT family N-acetyltransferase [Anaerolineales bacterium]